MRKDILAIVFMTAVFALSGYGQTDDPFASKDGKFTVIPPAGFDKSKFEVQTTDGMAWNQYSMYLDRGTCLMVYFDLSNNVLKTKSTRKILEDGRDSAVKSAGGTLDSQEDLTVDAYPALSINFHDPGDKTTEYAHVIFVVANSRIYTFLFLSTDKAELTKPDVEKFFSSIHIQK